MNWTERPVSILCVAFLYIGVGIIGFVHHFPGLLGGHRDAFWILLVQLIAIVAGVFILYGRNWARWLAVAWIAFHVAISFPVLLQIVIHSLLLVAIAWILFRRAVRPYFTTSRETDSNSPGLK